jgi:molybdopterin synthase sulfur carrier subunit
VNTFTLKFFARLREETKTDALEIPLSEVASLGELKEYLQKQYPHWSGFLSGKLLSAVNQQMVNDDVPLHAGDEVALFPPVTGG